MSDQGNKLLASDISRLYPQIDIRLIFANNFSIGNFFNFKDRISPNIKSNIVYKYSCSLCSVTYLGQSIRHFHIRVPEIELHYFVQLCVFLRTLCVFLSSPTNWARSLE